MVMVMIICFLIRACENGDGDGEFFMMPVRMISANYHYADDDNGDHGGSVDDNALVHTPPGLAVMVM